jgi:phosphoserine aminotransferase
MARIINFSPGPATIAEAVLIKAQSELLDWQGSGMSIMEISHRSTDFIERVLEPAKANVKKLLNIPDNYHIIFISTGASHQFSAVPLNLLAYKPGKTADYIYTGIWSGKALKEAQRYGEVRVPVNSEANHFTDIADEQTWHLNPHASYVHYTPNETVNGLEFHAIPNTGEVPLVADMSSTILSRPIDVSRFGVIYAGAQKNIGPAGLTLVIVREDLVGHAEPLTPYFYNYENYVRENSLCNTPATFSIYLAGLVFEWLLANGGLATMAEVNHRKARKLYDYIDTSGFYRNEVNPHYRSWMNVIFFLPSPELDLLFVKEAAENGLVNLKGHKLSGGIRASIYNALSEASVDLLITFMKDFVTRHA